MIVSLDRITDPEMRRAIERAQAKTRPLAVTVTERGDGFVRGQVACNGGCGARQFHGATHDVVIWWNMIATCDCPAVHGLCYHLAAMVAAEGGAFPDKPKDCTAYGCGAPLMYWGDGNGHAAQCPRVDDPEDVYQAPTPEAALRPEPRTRATTSARRQAMIERTRPVISLSGRSVRITRECGHAIMVVVMPGADMPLPLSPFEGCPYCAREGRTQTYPPANDTRMEAHE